MRILASLGTGLGEYGSGEKEDAGKRKGATERGSHGGGGAIAKTVRTIAKLRWLGGNWRGTLPYDRATARVKLTLGFRASCQARLKLEGSSRKADA